MANAIGPLAAIYQVWRYGEVSAKNPVQTYLLAIGGVGICLGLATCECCSCLLTPVLGVGGVGVEQQQLQEPCALEQPAGDAAGVML